MTTNNPFAALLEIQDTAVDTINHNLIENVFLFTLRSKAAETQKHALINLSELIIENNETNISEELLAHALFERLMLSKENLKEYLFPGPDQQKAVETPSIIYLFQAFERTNDQATQYPTLREDCEKMQKLIITNASTCFRQPELFPQHTSMTLQWLQLLESDEDRLIKEFLVKTVEQVIIDVETIEALGALKVMFYPIFGELQKRIARSNLINLDKRIYTVLSHFVSDKRVPQLGEILIDYTTPNPKSKGWEYVDTLLGQLLCISILPKTSTSQYEFFGDIQMEVQLTDPSLWQLMSQHQRAVFLFVKQLLVLNAITKQKTLQWIANCLQANASRGQIWGNLNMRFEEILNQNASDSFMIGLTSVLLRLCEPLCDPQLKVMLVDPTYCAVQDGQRTEKQVNMLKAVEETCLLPTEENEERRTAVKYNFITEIFYMTHKAIELSYRACIERYINTTRELNNLQASYADILNSDPNSDIANNMLRMLKEQMQQHLCMRNTLMEPENDSNLVKILEASSIWLTEISLVPKSDYDELVAKDDYTLNKRYNPQLPEEIKFIPSYLKSVPENIIDNLVSYLSFSRNFPNGQFIEMYQSSHDAFFKMILLFMGNAKLAKNPHLRAKLAEALEILLPKKISGSARNSFSSRVFDTHADRLRIVNSLLNVFVSIEMTGQSVQFEQKFNYRRPMYAIMEYLWTKNEQIDCFKELAFKAESNIEAIEPPLFLRFINLLINDAIFLLDESLSNLQQIRQLQDAQESGEWQSLSSNERQQNLSNLQHLGMLARFDNILGRETINILKLLTSEIKSIFCHNSMVDRIAAMLNYFLLNLVGPQKEKFKVKDKKEFEFDPAQTVMEICRIYVNLSCSDKFCLAVSQDGRSYSTNLFNYAENILARIGGGVLIADIVDFAEKVRKLEMQYRTEQEFIADAPDEFLDPIMSTLMTDPVILPSSKVTVDRSTIARHLLSDQTDPFNRASLTMDKVIPNEDLKNEIEKWLLEKRTKR